MINNCLYATKKLLTLLKVKFTSEYLQENLLSHPNYPSLLSVTDTLEKYNIETLAVKIEVEELKSMPLPCIVQVKENQEPLFFVLKNISDVELSYYDNNNKFIQSPIEEFVEKWTGVCLIAEVSEFSKEKGIKKRKSLKRNQNILMSLIGLFLLIWATINFFNSVSLEGFLSKFYIITYMFLKIIGFTVGFMLLWFEIDQYNPNLQNFCSGVKNKKINCNAVLGSKHAILLNGGLSLSLLSFSYFFATLFILLYGFSSITFSLLGLLSFISLPVILLSIYYQTFIIKQWCKFCVIIQAVIVGEIIITFLSKYYLLKLKYEMIPILLVFLLLPILFWKFVKPLLQQKKELILHKRSLRKIKNDIEVFETLLKNSRKLESKPEGLGIYIGNESQSYHVIKVCNPYCEPCADAHPILEDLVKSGKITLQIIYNAKSIDDQIGEIVSHFLAIDDEGNDKEKIHLALDDWYLSKQKNYLTFAKKFPIKKKLVQQKDRIESMGIWCNAEKIVSTPTIFVNGYQLPKEYSIQDFREVLMFN